MYKNEREREIMDILQSTGYATVDVLARRLHISASSIRRDLTALEQRGMVHRSYGGVEIADAMYRNVPYAMRVQESLPEKKRIAAAAARLINEGDVIFVDGSSTCSFLFRELPPIKGITVVTNSIDGLQYLTGFDVKVISTGGMINEENRQVLIGPTAEETVSRIHADIAFFATSGLDDDGVITDGYMAELPICNRMRQNARKRVFLCDGHKVGKTSVYYQCSLNDVDYVVSDVALADRYKQFPNVTFIQAGGV